MKVFLILHHSFIRKLKQKLIHFDIVGTLARISTQFDCYSAARYWSFVSVPLAEQLKAAGIEPAASG